MTDRLYREWIQRQRSCLTGRYSEWIDGEGRNPACHVRRAGPAGTGYKPEFSAIPLTNLEHAVQSNHGELACLKEFLPKSEVKRMFDGLSHEDAVRKAKEFFDDMAQEYFELWCETPEVRKCVRDIAMV